MLHKTKGIVLHHIPYTDSSVIVKIYTDLFGLGSFIAQGIKGTKKNLRPYLTQPLTCVEMEIYHRETRSIQRIKEINRAIPFQTIPFENGKRQLAFFFAETILRTVREEESNNDLFDFLMRWISWLDEANNISCKTHLFFLVSLTRHLGFYPDNGYSGECVCFDMRNGRFMPSVQHGDRIPPPLSLHLSSLLALPFEKMHEISVPAEEIRQLSVLLQRYYRIHLPGMQKIKSLEMMDV